MKERPKSQLKFFFLPQTGNYFQLKKEKENASLKLFPNLKNKINKNKMKRMKENVHQSNFTVKYILVPKRTTNNQDN